MAGKYQDYNLSIKENLPEWMKNDVFLDVVEKYTEEFESEIIDGFLKHLGLIQPVQIWKDIPVEYNYVREYNDFDENVVLSHSNAGDKVGPELRFNEPGDKFSFYLPNMKRPARFRMRIVFSKTMGDFVSPINWIQIKNASQTLKINDIDNQSTIDIFSDGQVLIDKVNYTNYEGEIHRLYGNAKTLDPEELAKLSMADENKETKFSITTSNTNLSFKVFIEVIEPTYVTEQHVRLASISKLPIERVELYGHYCHEFNPKQGWQLLYEKDYNNVSETTVYDRFTKQFDVEIFKVKVFFRGMKKAIERGFPVDRNAVDKAFAPNDVLDYWGILYSLPRRYYRPDITIEEEENTYPRFYNYDIEQDYYYEQRMVNEYQKNFDKKDNIFIKDSNLNNIGIVSIKNPFIEDTYLYTESIPATPDYDEETGDILPISAYQDKTSEGVEWKNPEHLLTQTKRYCSVKLSPYYRDNINDKNYFSKKLYLSYPKKIELPENIKITGIELKIEAFIDVYSNEIHLDKSYLKIPIKFGNEIKYEKLPLESINEEWKQGLRSYTIGGYGDSLGLDESLLTRENLEQGCELELCFKSDNTYLTTKLDIKNIYYNIHYYKYEEEFDVNIVVDSKQITKGDKTRIKIQITNVGEVPVTDRDIYIASPTELQPVDNQGNIKNAWSFSLDVGETVTVGEIPGEENMKEDEIKEEDKNKYWVFLQNYYNENQRMYDNKVAMDADGYLSLESHPTCLSTGIYEVVIFVGEKSYKNQITVTTK